ncbi:MAG: hypothetical protein GF344_18805 [Chitinivibrionales bacterium]|nr:hypothetical protein [Chitinivibrionales bacterium]MBD3358696.1 hypothetical protein [Chitinivibrionales bacterium]
MFSPRFALISEINKNHAVRAIWQKSNRVNTHEQLKTAEMLEEQSREAAKTDTSVEIIKANTEPEILRTAELIYSGIFMERLTAHASVYYNWLDLVGWINTTATTVHQAEQQVLGLEIEAQYKTDRTTVGLNASFAKQTEFDYEEGVTHSQYSYADLPSHVRKQNGTKLYWQDKYDADADHSNGQYNVTYTKGDLDLVESFNNYPEVLIKAFGTQSFLDGRIKLHANVRGHLGYPGFKNYLKMNKLVWDSIIANVEPTNDTTAQARAFSSTIQEEYSRLADPGATFSLGVTVSPLDFLHVKFHAENLIKYNHVGRSYDYGEGLYYFGRILAHVMEPLALSLKVKVDL